MSNSNAKKAKRSYLAKLRKMVASHTYDLGKKVLDEGIENAKELHDVDLPVNKRLKDIVKEVVDVNTKVKNYIKATKDEVSEVVKEGTKQAVAAIKNDKKDLTNEEDEFLSSFGIDLDDMDFDDDDDDMSNDDMDDIGEESAAQSMWDGAKDYTERRYPTTVSKLTNDDISAAIFLLIQNIKCPHIRELYATHSDEINNIIVNGTSSYASDIKSGTGDKLNYVKNMISDINSDMLPNVGTEDDDNMDEEMSQSGVVIEVIETELPTKIESNQSLVLKKRLHDVILKYFSKLETCVLHDEEILAILSIAESKIDAVANYLATLCEESSLSISNTIMCSLTELVPDCIPIGKRLVLAFYLGIIPEDQLEPAKRIISIYYNKIKNMN